MNEDISTLELCIKSVDTLMNLVEDISKKDGSERAILLDLRNSLLEVKNHISSRPLMVEFGKEIEEDEDTVDEDTVIYINYRGLQSVHDSLGMLMHNFSYMLEDDALMYRVIANTLKLPNLEEQFKEYFNLITPLYFLVKELTEPADQD